MKTHSSIKPVLPSRAAHWKTTEFYNKQTLKFTVDFENEMSHIVTGSINKLGTLVYRNLKQFQIVCLGYDK